MAARGGGANSGGVLPNLLGFGPKAAILRPKEPQNPRKTPKRREKVATLTRAMSLPRVKEPSGALQLHDMSEKRPQKGAKKPQNVHNVHQHPETKHGPYLGLRGSKTNSEGT